jgi:hypothetical protein
VELRGSNLELYDALIDEVISNWAVSDVKYLSIIAASLAFPNSSAKKILIVVNSASFSPKNFFSFLAILSSI